LKESRRQIEAERLTPAGKARGRAHVVVEQIVEIAVNGQVLAALQALPGMERELGAGFLSSAGLVRAREALGKVVYDKRRRRVEVEAQVSEEELAAYRERVTIGSGCGGGTGERVWELSTECLEKFNLFVTVSREDLLGNFHEFIRHSELYRKTRGVHSAAAYRDRERLAFAEDIGRHNAVDKVLGRCFLEGEATGEVMILTTGRLTAEVALKAARHGVPVLASRSVATEAAVELAKQAQLALVGECRRDRAVVYNSFWRIV